MGKIITKKMTIEEVKELGIDNWSQWECEPKTFDWNYNEKETAYVFEGDVIVTAEGESTHITDGMLVTFPKGMSCVWEVRKTIKKVYTFN